MFCLNDCSFGGCIDAPFSSFGFCLGLLERNPDFFIVFVL